MTDWFDYGDEVFWLVACTQAEPLPRERYRLRGGPRFIHETEASAEQEAVRLAKLNPDHRFAVCKAIATVRMDKATSAPRWSEAYVPRWRGA